MDEIKFLEIIATLNIIISDLVATVDLNQERIERLENEIKQLKERE